MDFGFTPWTGYLCLFTSFFTAAEMGAEDPISIHAEPLAVEIGHRLEVTCSATCPAVSIVMEGIKDRNSTMQNNKLTYSVPSIQSWLVKVACQVKCSSGPVFTSQKMITVYNQDLNISSPPEGLEINKTYSLECIGPKVNPEKKLILRWLRGSEIVQNNSAEDVGSLYPNERLRSVFNFTAQSSDDGQVYTCLSEVLLDSNDTLPIANSSVTLKTYYKPRSIIILAKNRTISESPIHLGDGDNITLVCDAEGNPKPALTWEFPQKHNIVNSSSAVLHIYDAMTDNNGVYKCIATNKFGTAEKKVDIKVTEMGAEDPISIHAEPLAVEIGHRLEVTCSATCPAVSIVMEGIKDRNSTMQNNKLTYSVPSIQSWLVKVACQVKCSSGPVFTSQKMITVYNQDLNISSPPEGLEINKTYSLECIGPKVNPEKKLILRWLRGSEIVQNNSAEDVGSLYPNERLRSVFNFTAQSSDDGQVYTCLSEVLLDSNDTLPIANSSVTLKTYYKPRSIIILAKNRTISESPIHLGDGDNITLVCDAEGNPKPALTWEFPQKHNIVNSSSAVLHIYDAMTDNNGVYKCIATNKFGTAEKKVDIKVTGRTSVIVAASISAAAIATLATGAVIYYFYQRAQKIQKYKLQKARPNNNLQVPSG